MVLDDQWRVCVCGGGVISPVLSIPLAPCPGLTPLHIPPFHVSMSVGVALVRVMLGATLARLMYVVASLLGVVSHKHPAPTALEIFLPASSSLFLKLRQESYVVRGSVGAGYHVIPSCSLHFDHLWFFEMVSVCFQVKFL